MKLLYFAWVREKIGVAEEISDLPEGVSNVSDLIDWLKTKGGGYSEAFSDNMIIRVAVNQEYVMLDHPIMPEDEIAFFPPVTGG